MKKFFSRKLLPLDRLYYALSGGTNQQPAAVLVLKIKTLSAHVLSIQQTGLVRPLNLGTIYVPLPASSLDTKMNNLQARLLQS